MANEFYASVKRGLEQALAYERGNKDAAKSTVVSVAALSECNSRQDKITCENS